MARRNQVTYSSHPNRATRAVHRQGDRQFRTYDTSYIRPKQSIIPGIIAGVLALCLVGGAAYWVTNMFGFLKPAVLLEQGQSASVEIPEGSDARSIASILYQAGLIESEQAFSNRVNQLGVASQLKPGTYELEGGSSLDAIIKQLEAGPGMLNALTIPEGSTRWGIAQAVDEATDGRISADDFLAATADASVYADDYYFLSGVGSNNLEGFLFPKTYDITADATAESVTRLMLDQFETEIAGMTYSDLVADYSWYDIVKLASVVEKEAPDDELIRKQVAAVFINRLNSEELGYRLQSDATTAYEVGHDPTPEDLQAEGEYNTYLNAGLPPTPICNPGLGCIEAACNPDPDSIDVLYYFYFEPDENGNMQYTFSETYEDHQQAYGGDGSGE